ncbi:diguanylate cyclase domain-containing protein [Cellulomonas aerilata]|uniref:GGDEF domain-containing protein n=1 Tax=Cellulomonas aerilata TaxID=515326 RepID=A0A512DGY8_9CELL|nr:diguanylate cyclase [Cellulomonas aerilata]GEO35741.1 hypothetical protein CAE01nite_34660 [Cellulomonas aerilata]
MEVAALIMASVAASRTTVVICDASAPDLPVVYVNPAFTELTGYTEAEAVGTNCRFLQGPATDPGTVRAIRDAVRAGEPVECRIVNYRADGTEFWNELRISPVHDATGSITHYMATQRDVTDEMTEREAERQAATHDPLTGLLNRTAFVEELDRELARAARNGTAVGVLFADVDHFKKVNDTRGHLVGDEFLRHVSRLLRRSLRTQDAVARLGGDEFVALLTDLPVELAQDSVDAVVEDLERSLAQPVPLDGTEYRTTVSIGAAVHTAGAATGRQLLDEADSAMYARKRRAAARADHRGR